METKDSRIEFQVLDLMDRIRYFFCIVEDSHGDDYRTTRVCGPTPDFQIWESSNPSPPGCREGGWPTLKPSTNVWVPHPSLSSSEGWGATKPLLLISSNIAKMIYLSKRNAP
jgi:hypothetical protein